MAVKPIPEGYQRVIPYLIVEGAARLMDFMREAFGAEEQELMTELMVAWDTPRYGSVIRW